MNPSGDIQGCRCPASDNSHRGWELTFKKEDFSTFFGQLEFVERSFYIDLKLYPCRFYLHEYSFLLFFVGSSSFTKPINFGVSWKSIYFSYITHCPWTTCGFRVHLHSDEYISSPAFYAELQVMSTWLPHRHLIFRLFQTYFTLPWTFEFGEWCYYHPLSIPKKPGSCLGFLPLTVH